MPNEDRLIEQIKKRREQTKKDTPHPTSDELPSTGINLSSVAALTPITANQESMIEKLYSIGGFHDSFPGQKLGLERLESTVQAIDSTQGEFERLVRYEERPVYAFFKRLWSAPIPDIHNLYSLQLRNVEALNQILIGLINSTNPVYAKITEEVDVLHARVTANQETVKSLDDKLPGIIDDEKKKQEEVSDLEKTDPEYLRNMIEGGRRTDEVMFLYKEALKGKNQDYTALINSILLERIVRAFYYSIMGMSNTTQRYCETLKRAKVVYPTVEALAKASISQDGGLSVLSDYTNEITRRFTTMVENVMTISRRDPFQEVFDTQYPNLLDLHDRVREDTYTRNRLNEQTTRKPGLS